MVFVFLGFAVFLLLFSVTFRCRRVYIRSAKKYHSCRKKKTRREEFLEIMDEIIPWDEWVGVISPHYPNGKRGRPPMGIERMLRTYLLQIWFNLSDPATEDAIYDSYAMRKFTGINFMTETVPDETTLCKFRHLMKGGTIVDATIINAPSSTKNAEKARDPEMHQTNWYEVPHRRGCSANDGSNRRQCA